ncbi:YihY/virulence factor BrkB family protein [Negadavirga shengliensis]|uniref:YihY/virulence factor BrkB family protein n=1 Tax=Negadavirga shengliensis TaxID=1389218 RepID=A0ABV9T032_9BACT
MDSVKDFGRSDSMTFAASTAFYTIFSLPAFLIIVMNIAAAFYSENTVREELLVQASELIGEDSAKTLDDIMRNVSIDARATIAKVIGIGVLIFSATTVFVSLQNSINHIWHIKPKPEKGLIKFGINRLLSFSMVASIGFLLLVSLLADAFIMIMLNYFSDLFEGNTLYFASVINFFFTQALLVLIFGLMYKILPDAKVKWKDVWLGAFVTMVLFALGKYLIGIYMGNADVGTYYGTAGSLVIVLVWVYYSVVIFLFGAQVTYFIAEKVGGSVIPLKQAVKVEVVEVEMEEDGRKKETRI